MKILYSYLRNYWGLLALALALAAINQVFSLLDPYIFRQIIDRYVVKPGGNIQQLNFWPFLTGGAGCSSSRLWAWPW